MPEDFPITTIRENIEYTALVGHDNRVELRFLRVGDEVHVGYVNDSEAHPYSLAERFRGLLDPVSIKAWLIGAGA